MAVQPSARLTFGNSRAADYEAELNASIALLAKIKNRQDRFQLLFYTQKRLLVCLFLLLTSAIMAFLPHIALSEIFGKHIAHEVAASDWSLYIMTALISEIVIVNVVAIIVLIYGLVIESNEFAIRVLVARQVVLPEPEPSKRAIAKQIYGNVRNRPVLRHTGHPLIRRGAVIDKKGRTDKVTKVKGVKMGGTTSAYLLSMAISDLMLGLLIAPGQAFTSRNGGAWYFGDFLCDLWRALDIFFCTSSAMHTAAIAVDRWWNVIQDQAGRTSLKLKKTLIAFLWILSAMVSFPVLYIWQMESVDEGLHRSKIPRCEPISDDFYIMLTILVSFVLPLTLTIAFYVQILLLIRDRWNRIKIASTKRFGATMTMFIRSSDGVLSKFLPAAGLIAGMARQASSNNEFIRNPDGFYYAPEVASIAKTSATFKQSRRIVKTMSLVVAVYIICWLPLYSTLLIKVFCNCLANTDFEMLMTIFTWLSYANSGINPVIYFVSLSEYRRLLSGLASRFYNELLKRPFKEPLDNIAEMVQSSFPRLSVWYLGNVDVNKDVDEENGDEAAQSKSRQKARTADHDNLGVEEAVKAFKELDAVILPGGLRKEQREQPYARGGKETSSSSELTSVEATFYDAFGRAIKLQAHEEIV